MSSGLPRPVETAAAAAATAQPTSETPTLHARTSDGDYCVIDLGGGEDDDIFVDPIVERERRRKQKRRRREQPAATGSAGCGGGGVEAHNETNESVCDRSSESRRAANPRRCTGQKDRADGEAAAARCEPDDSAITSTPPADKGDGVSGGLDSTSGGGGTVCYEGNVVRAGCIGNGIHGTEISRGPAAAATTAAAALALRSSEGLAELSEVSDLLSDESIGAVILAATMESAGTSTAETTRVEKHGHGGGGGGGGGDSCEVFGVPEMTITGRRLNREVL